MSGKRIYVGSLVFGIADAQAETVVKRVTEAMEDGSVQSVEVLGEGDRPVTLYLNGKALDAVAVDLDTGARPSEISGTKP